MNLLFHVGVFWWLTVIPQLFAVIGFLDISALTSLVWHLGFALMLWSLYVVLRDVLHVKENNIVFALILAVFSYFLAQTLLGSLLIGSSYHLF